LPEELPDNSEESPEETAPLEVKVTNQSKESRWDDSKDDVEYDDLGITAEDMDI